MSEKLKVVLVDDQCLCRRGLSELLANCYDFSVLGATASIDELRTLCLGKPDLLIVDLRMKPMDGIALITQLRSEGCTIPAVMLTMSDLLRGEQSGQEPKNSLKLLTEREREIIQLLARGESNKAIAQSLSISYDTVKQHVRHILTKLNLSSRVKAAVLFAKEGEVSRDDSASRN